MIPKASIFAKYTTVTKESNFRDAFIRVSLVIFAFFFRFEFEFAKVFSAKKHFGTGNFLLYK